MEQQPFDKMIKDSLENLEVPYNAAHWEQMELLLHNLPVGEGGAIDAHFDALIKNKIGNIEASNSALGWAGIAAGLSEAEAIDAQFDNIFSEKLANIKETPAPNWDGLEKALEVGTKADLQFDAQVAVKLQNISSSYQPSSWEKLLTTLNANFAIRERLYRYKLIEATLMILLLLNIYQYLPTPTSFTAQENIQQKIFEQPSIDEVVVPTTIPTPIEATKIPTKQINQDKQENNAEKPTLKEKSVVAVISNEDEQLSSTIVNTEVPAAAATTNNNTEENITTRNYTITRNLSPLNSSSIGQKTGLTISVGEMNQHLTAHTETGNTLIKVVPSLRPNFVESQYITPLGCKDCKYTKIPARLRIGLIANLAIDNAYVSGGEILDINAFSEQGFGYGSGFSLGFKSGRWEVETGLIYAAKKYDPNIVDVPKANEKRTHFQTVHLQTVNIPATLRYNYAIFGKGKWHLYSQLGAALNVVLRAEYDLAEISAISRSSVNDITTSRISQIDFNNGVLAGGGLKSNRYLSLKMGAGAERYISPSWSIFVQPDFHFHFSGNRIGPTEDRINTLNLSFGARKSLR